MFQRLRFSLSFLPVLSAGLLLFAASAPVHAASSSDKADIPDRLREEASRPMRWIIESAKLDRRKGDTDASPAPPKARQARSVERAARAAPAEAPAAEVEDLRPVMRPTRVVREAAVEERSIWVPSVRSEPPRVAPPPQPQPAPELLARWTPPPSQAPAAVPVSAPMSVPVSIPATVPAQRAAAEEPIYLVPISQAPPVVWRGLCGVDCDKYFYRISFKVKPNGQVDADSIRLVESNYPKLKRAVMDAVATWRYMPMQGSQEEEVTLRISAR